MITVFRFEEGSQRSCFYNNIRNVPYLRKNVDHSHLHFKYYYKHNTMPRKGKKKNNRKNNRKKKNGHQTAIATASDSPAVFADFVDEAEELFPNLKFWRDGDVLRFYFTAERPRFGQCECDFIASSRVFFVFCTHTVPRDERSASGDCSTVARMLLWMLTRPGGRGISTVRRLLRPETLDLDERCERYLDDVFSSEISSDNISVLYTLRLAGEAGNYVALRHVCLMIRVGDKEVVVDAANDRIVVADFVEHEKRLNDFGMGIVWGHVLRLGHGQVSELCCNHSVLKRRLGGSDMRNLRLSAIETEDDHRYMVGIWNALHHLYEIGTFVINESHK